MHLLNLPLAIFTRVSYNYSTKYDNCAHKYLYLSTFPQVCETPGLLSLVQRYLAIDGESLSLHSHEST